MAANAILLNLSQLLEGKCNKSVLESQQRSIPQIVPINSPKAPNNEKIQSAVMYSGFRKVFSHAKILEISLL